MSDVVYKFLKPEELDNYSNTPITDQTLLSANVMLESYLGDITKQSTKGEHIHLMHFRHARLKHIHNLLPLVSIDKVMTMTKTPFGISKEEVNVDSVYVDDYGYVSFIGQPSLAMMIYGAKPTDIIVDYTWGYETVPSDLKFACAAIAQNLAKRGTYGLKSLTDFDVKLAFVDDSIITNDIRMVIDKYKDV